MDRVRIASYDGDLCFIPLLIMVVGWKVGSLTVGSLILDVYLVDWLGTLGC